MDNRPLKYHEFEEKINQTVFVSATPGEYEIIRSCETIENTKKSKEQINIKNYKFPKLAYDKSRAFYNFDPTS